MIDRNLKTWQISWFISDFFLVENFVSSAGLLENREDELDRGKEEAERCLELRNWDQGRNSYQAKKNEIQKGLLNCFWNKAFVLRSNTLANSALEIRLPIIPKPGLETRTLFHLILLLSLLEFVRLADIDFWNRQELPMIVELFYRAFRSEINNDKHAKSIDLRWRIVLNKSKFSALKIHVKLQNVALNNYYKSKL